MLKKLCAIFVVLLITFSVFATNKSGRFSQVLTIEEGYLNLFYIDLDVPEGSKDKSGDATLIITPDDKVVLLDCGHPDSYKDTELVLNTLGIKRIDLFINSHPHIDHLGAFPEIAKKYQVAEVIRSSVDYSQSSYYRAFIDSIKKRGIKDSIVKEGDEFNIGAYVNVKVYNPPAVIEYPDGYPNGSTQFLNNNSLALKFTYGDTVYLSCGDLYLTGEKEIVKKYPGELKADIIKANHHLIDTSNQSRWVKATKPKVVIAMNDTIGSMSVYQRYVKAGATVYHTLHNGVIKVVLDDKQNITVVTQFDSWVEEGNI